jgi:hypothetical protein
MLGYLAIMAVVSLLVTDMINLSFRMVKEARLRDTLIHRVDSALGALRRDTWHAASIQAAGNQVTLASPGSTITWRMETDGTLTRTAPATAPEKTTWIEMPPFTFTAAGPALQVDVESGSGAAKHEQATLPSQQLLAGGAP